MSAGEWLNVNDARVDGSICDLRFRDGFGFYEVVDGPGHFLHDDGHWYLIEPPTMIRARVSHFRRRA